MGQEAGTFYVGLDVSVARTAVCITDAAGQVVREQSVASTPEAIAAAIRANGREVERVGLEAGINSAWIARGLGKAGLPVIVIDATHAAAALKTGFRDLTTRPDPARVGSGVHNGRRASLGLRIQLGIAAVAWSTCLLSPRFLQRLKQLRRSVF